MTANALWLKHGWITANAPMRNGVGRFIPQLARVTLKFCKGHGGSNGVGNEAAQNDAQGSYQGSVEGFAHAVLRLV